MSNKKEDVADLMEDEAIEDGDFDDDEEVVNQFFWSLVVQPGKKYTQTLPYNLHVNHVSLDENAKDGSKSILYCETDDGVSHPICTLRAGVNDQMSLNLLFPSDGRLCLRSSPNSAVIHLLGYCEELESPSDFEDEDEEGEEFDDEEESDEEEEEEEEEKEVEVKKVEEKKDVKRKAVTAPTAPDTPAKKQKVDVPLTPAPPAKVKATAVPKSQSQPSVAQPAKAPEKKEEQKKPAAPATPKPKSEEKPKEDSLGVQKKLGMGVTYTLSQRGQGTKATPGKKVHVQYRGWLKKGGKEFDKGKIQFRLGLGEVIKGWDIGVEGMQVGEKRTLTIPANAGYGKRGAPPSIPPNADLQFDVTLLNVQ